MKELMLRYPKFAFILMITLIVMNLFILPNVIAQDVPEISPFELSRYPSGGSIQSAVWDEDSGRLLVSTRRQSIQIWESDAETPEIVLVSDGWVDGAVWNEAESAILSWSNAPLTCEGECNYSVDLWMDVDESATQPTIRFAHPSVIHSALWNEDERQVLTAAEDGVIRLWSVVDETIMADFSHEEAVLGAKFNDDESLILSWSMDGTARLWNIEAEEELARFEHEGWVEGAAWNGDESQILTCGRDGFAKIWDAEGELLQELGHDDWVTSAQWSENNRQILTSSADGFIRVWDARSGNEDQRVEQQGMVQGASWNSEDSQILAWSMTTQGHVVTIWDMGDSVQIASLAHDDVVRGASWNEDDNRVLTWSEDGTVRVWVVPSGNDCVITTSITVRQRSIPSVDGEIMGRLFEGDSSIGTGQTVGGDGFVWYQLIDESWVRSDVVETTELCEALPEIQLSE